MRSTDLYLTPIDQQFTDGLLSVIDQIKPRITWEDFERCFMDHPVFGDSFLAVMRELDQIVEDVNVSYKKELQALIFELENVSRQAEDEEVRELARRRAEIIDFLINHPKDALAVLESDA